VITEFDISTYPNEDVTKAGMNIKTASKALHYGDNIPARALSYLLRGFAKSSNNEFNSRCFQLSISDSIEGASTMMQGPSRSHHLLRLINSTVDKVTVWYRNALQAGQWSAATSRSATSLAFNATASIPKSLSPALQAELQTVSPELFALFQSRSSDNRSGCFNCGEQDHVRADCPKPNNYRRSQSPRKSSRHHPFTRGRPAKRDDTPAPRSRDGSRGASRSNSRGPSDRKSRSNNSDRRVAFDQSSAPSALNVSISAARSYDSDSSEDVGQSTCPSAYVTQFPGSGFDPKE
jgi:hypothetical protein